MSTYSIVANTNQWIANRDIMFSGHTEVCLHSGLTLKNAQSLLLELYNRMYEETQSYAPNWGIAVIHGNASPTASDGTRSFEYDSRYFSIVIENQ